MEEFERQGDKDEIIEKERGVIGNLVTCQSTFEV